MAISLTGSAMKYCQQLSDSLEIPRDSYNLVSTYFNTSITVFICHSSVDSLWVHPLVMDVYQCGLILFQQRYIMGGYIVHGRIPVWTNIDYSFIVSAYWKTF